MNSKRSSKIRRLVHDLRHRETRGAALGRIRRRAAATVARRRGGSAPTAVATRYGGIVPTSSTTATQRSDAWYVGAWSRLARGVLGLAPTAGGSIDPATAADTVKLARRQRARATLTEALAQGEPLDAAVCRTVAALAEVKDWNAAWAMTEGIGRTPEGARAAVMGRAVIWHRRRQLRRVWETIRHLRDEDLASFIPVEAVDGALAVGDAAARERSLSIARFTADMPAEVLVDLAGRFLAVGERQRSAALVEELRGRSTVSLDDRRRHSLSLIEHWLGQPRTTVPRGSVPIGLMGYQTPDPELTSGNLGDYVQTLSLLGNLVRMSDVTFSGDRGLGALATELQARVQPQLRRPGVSGSIHLVEVNREFSSADDIPEGTWMFAFGWHMHPLYWLRFDFPYHRNIRPLFISFHVNRLDMLSEEALGYLREHGPIGCRDWTTVFLLLSAGVDAFFTGCVTTTVDGIFPPRDVAYRGKGPVGLIDLPARAAGRDARRGRVYTHQSDEYRNLSAAEGLRTASDVLGMYQHTLDRVVTSRLHAYLPLTALGVPVEFKPTYPGDVRFAGLTGFRPGDTRLADLSHGIRDLISQILPMMLAGATEPDVYARWRELTRAQVAGAKERFAAPSADRATGIDVDAAVAGCRNSARRFGPHDAVEADTLTDIALCFDQNLMTQAAVTVESMRANAAGPLRLWVLGRGLSDGYQEWLAAAFPTTPMTFFSCDHVDYGGVGRLPAWITISTMDRLLLPLLLEAVDRVVYTDIDTLVLDDVGVLARTDLEGRSLAARDSNVSEATEWRRAARQLAESDSLELLRRMGLAHGFGPAALNAGVLVLDLERMRRDGFTATALAWVERYGLNDQDIMIGYAGPDRARLDPRWNALPVFEDVPEPSIVHWATIAKPWEAQLTYRQDVWRGFEARLLDRAGSPPLAREPRAADGGHRPDR